LASQERTKGIVEGFRQALVHFGEDKAVEWAKIATVKEGWEAGPRVAERHYIEEVLT
jgi:hypothetical protein